MNDVLFEDYLADRLSAADVVRLKQLLASDPNARARFVEVLLEWELLSETARQLTTNICSVVDINSSQPDPSKRHRPALRVAPTRPLTQPLNQPLNQLLTRHALKILIPMGALAATLMIALLAIRPASEPQSLGYLSFATTGVTIQRGESVLIAHIGSGLQPGDHVQIADGAQARMEYVDHTILSFDQRTEAHLLADGLPADRVGKQVTLVSGRVTAEVAKQPTGRPMVFTTPNAQAMVIGTVLSLVYAPTESFTRLEVAEGKVGILRISATPEALGRATPIEVSTGHFAMVSGNDEIVARPMNTAVQIAQVPAAIPSIPAMTMKSDEGGRKMYLPGLRATYYKANNLTDAMYRRIETDIHVDLGLDPQSPEQRHGDFSVIWSGYLQPRFSEKYLLTLSSDSHARVFIDNNPVIDSWGQNHTSERQGGVLLEAGKRHVLRVEYKQPNAGMRIKLSWVSKSQQPEIIPVECLSTEP